MSAVEARAEIKHSLLCFGLYGKPFRVARPDWLQPLAILTAPATYANQLITVWSRVRWSSTGGCIMKRVAIYLCVSERVNAELARARANGTRLGRRLAAQIL